MYCIFILCTIYRSIHELITEFPSTEVQVLIRNWYVNTAVENFILLQRSSSFLNTPVQSVSRHLLSITTLFT